MLPKSDADARRILIVDDNADSAESMRMLLRMAGHHVEVLGEGARAVEVALAMLPHAVLLDIGLPDVNGYEVARRLRGHAELSDTLIIAATGRGRAQDLRTSHEAGIDVHMTKPIDSDRVLALIAAGRDRPA